MKKIANGKLLMDKFKIYLHSQTLEVTKHASECIYVNLKQDFTKFCRIYFYMVPTPTPTPLLVQRINTFPQCNEIHLHSQTLEVTKHTSECIYVNLKQDFTKFCRIYFCMIPTPTALLVQRIDTFPQFNEIF